jgi:hypothetical protein
MFTRSVPPTQAAPPLHAFDEIVADEWGFQELDTRHVGSDSGAVGCDVMVAGRIVREGGVSGRHLRRGAGDLGVEAREVGGNVSDVGDVTGDQAPDVAGVRVDVARIELVMRDHGIDGRHIEVNAVRVERWDGRGASTRAKSARTRRKSVS